MRIPLAAESYQARSRPLSAQRLVNLYPERAPDAAKTPLVLFGTPGLKLFATAGTGPIRCSYVMAGTLYVVSDTEFYSIDTAGTATLIDSITGSGAAGMDDNGSELVIVSGGNGWVYDGSTLTQIGDKHFPSVSSVTFLDGYHIFSKSNSGQFVISAFYDPTVYEALDFATAEADPDHLVRVLTDHQELWLFGEKTTEIWYNSGAAAFPFERIAGAFIERGCAAVNSVAKMDNSVFWLGDDLIVYRAEEYTPQRISTHPIEGAIATFATPSVAEGWTYIQDGHLFYVLTFEEATFVYDAASGLWHERQSYGLNRWRATCGTYACAKTLVGDYDNGNVYELDLNTYQDNGGTIMRTAISPPIHADTSRATMSRFQIEVESGSGLTTGQGSDPQAMLSWSDDGGRFFGNEHWASMGAIGEYKRRVIWRRLGHFRERIMKVEISDPIKVAIIAADADTQVG